MARILVTGGAGYVGSHCTKALAAAGHDNVVFDNLLFGHREFVRWGPLIEGDVRDASALDAVFSEYRFDAVMHFAALAYVGESVTAPGRYYDVNVTVHGHCLMRWYARACARLFFHQAARSMASRKGCQLPNTRRRTLLTHMASASSFAST